MIGPQNSWECERKLNFTFRDEMVVHRSSRHLWLWFYVVTKFWTLNVYIRDRLNDGLSYDSIYIYTLCLQSYDFLSYLVFSKPKTKSVRLEELRSDLVIFVCQHSLNVLFNSIFVWITTVPKQTYFCSWKYVTVTLTFNHVTKTCIC